MRETKGVEYCFTRSSAICTGRNDAVNWAVPVDEDDRSDVRAYLETMVGKGDTVALLAVSRWKSAAVVQGDPARGGPGATGVGPGGCSWISMRGAGKGWRGCAAIVDAGVVPTPAVIRQSARERYQVLRSSSSATRRSRR